MSAYQPANPPGTPPQGTVMSFLSSLAQSLLSGSVMAVVLTLVLSRTTDIFRSRRTWKEKSVAELLGPLYMQFERTKRAFNRYSVKNTYLEAQVLREGNLAIRDLLIRNVYLIPPHLVEDAARLVAHYDRWLEQYELLRSSPNSQPNSPVCFGP